METPPRAAAVRLQRPTPSNPAPTTMTSDIDWIDGQPVSRRFGDVFFARESGIAEKRHVFLGGNRLAERFAAMRPGERFVVGETGFGTGLSFLATWHCLETHAPPSARLDFVSVELDPLAPDALAAALALWPELAAHAAALQGQWSELVPGWHRFRFAQGRVNLTLAVADARDALAEMDVPADAWFLDGFAPAKNPQMWTTALLDEVGRLARPGTTFATYTAASEVRRGLEAAGFATERVPGFGRKREMLRGEMRSVATRAPRQPWFAPPPAHAGEREAVVVGAGLAGCAAADSLAARGWRVTVVDRHGGLAAGASGNPQGVLYARLAAHDTALRRLVLASYPHALRRLALALPEGDDTWRRTGVLQLAFDAEEAARQSALAASGFPHALFRAVSRDEGAALADVAMPSDGLFFPGGGWVHPPALCRALADHPAIDLRSGHVTGLARAGGRWRVLGAAGELASAPVVILAAAQETASLDVTRRLPLRTIAGQITEMPATAGSARLATVVTGKGYVAPARRGRHTVGATHRFGEASTDVRAEEHAENIAMLATLVPNLFELARAATLDPAVLAGRAGVRCTSPDTLPIVGPLADAAAFERTYAPLARDASLDLRDPAPWLPGLAITTAHGSRGLVTAMLAAEIVADALESAPGPVPASLLAAVHPNRFALRALVRRERGAPA